MIQYHWQKKPVLKYNHDVMDIVQYGSSIIKSEEPNDIDIAVIFRKTPLKQQLEESQRIKMQLEKFTDKPIHIKNFDMETLFNKGNFARESIMFYGKSIITGKYFAEELGLKPMLQAKYSLEGLEKKDKVRLHYALKGKGNYKGFLEKHNGQMIGPGIVVVPPEYEVLLLKKIKAITENYNTIKVFIQEQNLL